MFERVKNLRLSIIKQIELLASRYPDSISLAQGIPSFQSPPCVKRSVELALKSSIIDKYSLSPGLPQLRELIELNLEKQNMYYDWETEIIVTAGTIQGITATILALTNPGDEILIPDPTYTSYREVITLAGCQPVYVPLNQANNWSFEIERFAQAITNKTKAIFYCNPNNPTGTIYSQENLKLLAKLAEENNLFLISDEVYKEFTFDQKQIFSLAQVRRLRQRLVRIYGFSKAYAMTGWRVGYVHSDRSVIQEILKVHDCLVTCAAVVSQYAAIGALEMGETDLKKFNQRYLKLRDLVCDRLDRLSHVFQYTRPQSTYYVFPKIKPNHMTKLNQNQQIDSWDFAMKLLDKIAVAVVPGFAFGPNGEGHLRINFGRSAQDINRAFDRLDALFKV
ncbi:MAG: aminotransferase class I/II-fold pyridoxal phosphate-dependent enzyme [Candidatus Moranbacteria bacterium]|nr:aminotransferase class I/II-fold pyridoxal phosphate-dependent enzyme [Candidatus Moranbacteria bacterium]